MGRFFLASSEAVGPGPQFSVPAGFPRQFRYLSAYGNRFRAIKTMLPCVAIAPWRSARRAISSPRASSACRSAPAFGLEPFFSSPKQTLHSLLMLLSRPRSTRRKINEWGQMSARAYGMALVTVAAVLWSTGGIFPRCLDDGGLALSFCSYIFVIVGVVPK